MSKAEHGLKKGDRLEVKIESMAAGGQGFCRHEGVSIFVDRSVPGDQVELELYDVRKDFAHAKIIEMIEPSQQRVEPPCQLFNVCGGCQWQHIAYDAQLEYKTDIVRQVIKHIGGLDSAVVLPALASPHDLNYRNKVQYPVASPQKSSRILAGYYKSGSHDLVNIKHCPVQPRVLDGIMERAKLAAENAQFSAYDEKTHRGLLRHLIARYSFSEDETLLTLVLNTKPDSFESLTNQLQQFAKEMKVKCPGVIGVCVNFNNGRGNRIMGSETRLVRGRDHIIEKLCSHHEQAPEILKDGLKFQLSSASFFQVNSEQAEQMMDLVLDAVIDYKNSKQIERVPLVLDAFAGVASIALWVAPLAERVIAIEELADAVRNAEEVMQLNAVTNVEARCGTVEAVFPELLEQGLCPQIVILDPPRKGVAPEVLNCVAKLNPDRIIYVSCNPATLARDLKLLSESGYETKSIRPVDLFPHTFHVESVTVLDKRNQ